jgi:hypothetical protein
MTDLRPKDEVAAEDERTTLLAFLAHARLDEVEHSDRAFYSLRWILIHLIEEYARHCGHADLIRQAIDGQTGE